VTTMQSETAGLGWIRLGAILAGLAVILGALAAHGLEKPLAEKYAGQVRTVAGEDVPAARKYLGDFKTAAEYQMTHSLGLIAVGLLMGRRTSRALCAAAWCLTIGILLFSGSLYTLVLTGQLWMGAITPFGGVSFIIGWALIAWAACGRNSFGVDQ
jgi:uncharacterized membrane protein YgdD (TMEM256/DUF423 family)